jgi:hypothetical protein
MQNERGRFDSHLQATQRPNDKQLPILVDWYGSEVLNFLKAKIEV